MAEKKYKYLEDVATADIAFEAWGDTIEELFVSCAKATTDAMVELSDVNPKVSRKVEVSEKTEGVEMLLYNFLSEIIFYKDAETLFFSEFKIKITNSRTKLNATMIGEELNKKIQFKNDVKAITMHMLKIIKKNTVKNKYHATIVLDI